MGRPIVSLFTEIQDAKGAISITKMNFPTSTDIAILKTFARSTATMIDALIKGKILGVSIGIGVDSLPGGLKASALADSDVEERARFIWQAASGNTSLFHLPTFDEAKFVSGTQVVDTADTDVAAFVARIEAGQTVGIINVSPSDDAESDLTTLNAAYEAFGKDRG